MTPNDYRHLARWMHNNNLDSAQFVEFADWLDSKPTSSTENMRWDSLFDYYLRETETPAAPRC